MYNNLFPTDPLQTDPPPSDPPQTDPPQTDPPPTDPLQTDPPPSAEVSSYTRRPLFAKPITFRPKAHLVDQIDKLCKILSYHLGNSDDMKEWIDDIKKEKKDYQKTSFQEVLECLANCLNDPRSIEYPRKRRLKNIIYRLYNFELNKLRKTASINIHSLRRGKRGYQLKDTGEMERKEFIKKIQLLNLL